jgi:Heterokaryon incompatibility protein (HET)
MDTKVESNTNPPKDPLGSLNPYVSLKEASRFRDIYAALQPGSTRFLRYKRQSGAETPESDHHLIFNLEAHSLELEERRPSYSALSYTWGHPILDDFKDDFSHTIVCNGQLVPIGLNLYQALHYLFVDSDITPELIWIDAVCIDQSNIEERGAQVQMMAKIYSGAARVIVWLGQEDEDAQEASALLDEYVPVIQKIADVQVATDPTRAIEAGQYNVYDDPEFHLKYGITAKDLTKWKSLIRFFQRRWFRRLWVVQEIVFATSRLICCGSLRFDWFDVDMFVACVFGAQWCGLNLTELQNETLDIAGIFTLYRGVRLQAARIDEIENNLKSLSPEQKLYFFAEYCLTQSVVLQATDPRDNVFALSPLLGTYAARIGIKLIWLKPDYTLQLEDVMLRTVQLVLWKSRSVQLLSYVADPSERKPSSLPTWLPHFHIPGEVAAVETLLRIHGARHFHAGSSSTDIATSDLYIHVDTNEVEINGWVVDRIAEVIHFQHNMIDILAICLRLPLQYKNGQPPVEVLWRTLIAGRTDTAFPAPPETAMEFSEFVKKCLLSSILSHLQTRNLEGLVHMLATLIDIKNYCPHPALPSFEEFQSMISNPIRETDSLLSRLQGVNARDFRMMITPTLKGRKGKAVFRTEKGYLGLCPHSSHIGDEVWLFKGAKVLHILRAPEEGKRAQELVGESYLHGFMEGEGLLDETLTQKMALIK